MKIALIIVGLIVVLLFGLVAGSKLMPETEFVIYHAPPLPLSQTVEPQLARL